MTGGRESRKGKESSVYRLEIKIELCQKNTKNNLGRPNPLPAFHRKNV